LDDIPEVFDSVIDCGLFQVFSDEDRSLYVKELASVVKSSGNVFMMCFNDQEPPGGGPRRVSKNEIQSAFSEGREVESIQQRGCETRPDLTDITFSEGGPFAWFCGLRRLGQSTKTMEKAAAIA